MQTTIDVARTGWAERDLHYMSQALDASLTALGRVAPNPAVGAVVVRDGEVIATGVTQPPPGAHAEVMALRAAGRAAKGAELYVTLEPCAHHGRTPPCVDLVVDHGISRVVVACDDPNPLVDGRGYDALRKAGIAVESGCLETEAEEVLGGFFTRIATGRPRVTAKYAMTVDGRIATRTHHARWVSGPESRTHSHILRDRTDAILVGIGTVLDDDPSLTTRLPPDCCGYGGPHQPIRVVVDSHLRTPPAAALLEGSGPQPPVIYTTERSLEERRSTLRAAGAEVVVLGGETGRVDARSVLDDLGSRGVNDLLVEGGGTVHGSLFDGSLVDRVRIYLAPVIVGGRDAPSPVAGVGAVRMQEAWHLSGTRFVQLGEDLLLEAHVQRGSTSGV